MTDFLKRDGNVRVERNVEPKSLHLDDAVIGNLDAWPISLNVRHGNLNSAGINSDRGLVEGNIAQGNLEGNRQGSQWLSSAPDENETIKAKYLIGCDGAHSWTRNEIGLSLVGESTDQVWGVMDITPLTNFRTSLSLFADASTDTCQPISASLVQSTLRHAVPL